MTLLDQGQPADTTTKKHHTGLIAVLAILAVALIAAGAWLIVDRQQQQPLSAEAQQAAIRDVVTAHLDAVEARDRDAILATLTDDATVAYLLGKDDDPMVTSRDNYPGWVGWGKDRLTSLTNPVFFDDPPQMVVRARVDYPGLISDVNATPRIGSYVFTLREVDGQLKIASIVFTET